LPREIKEIILAHGHENILATHGTTLEITRDNHLTKKGTCIIAVSANKALAELSDEFKDKLRTENAKLTILIEVGDFIDTIQASGDPKLILTHPTDLVVRKSRHICSRTLAVGANKAACDLPKNLVRKLKEPDQTVKVTLTART
jgi:hypothetical protein